MFENFDALRFCFGFTNASFMDLSPTHHFLILSCTGYIFHLCFRTFWTGILSSSVVLASRLYSAYVLNAMDHQNDTL